MAGAIQFRLLSGYLCQDGASRCRNRSAQMEVGTILLLVRYSLKARQYRINPLKEPSCSRAPHALLRGDLVAECVRFIITFSHVFAMSVQQRSARQNS